MTNDRDVTRPHKWPAEWDAHYLTTFEDAPVPFAMTREKGIADPRLVRVKRQSWMGLALLLLILLGVIIWGGATL